MQREEPLHPESSWTRSLDRPRVQLIRAHPRDALPGVEPPIGERGVELDERDEDVAGPKIVGDLGGVGVLRDRQREVRQPHDRPGNRGSCHVGLPHTGLPPRMHLHGKAVSGEPHHRAAPSRATLATTAPTA